MTIYYFSDREATICVNFTEDCHNEIDAHQPRVVKFSYSSALVTVRCIYRSLFNHEMKRNDYEDEINRQEPRPPGIPGTHPDLLQRTDRECRHPFRRERGPELEDRQRRADDHGIRRRRV